MQSPVPGQGSGQPPVGYITERGCFMDPAGKKIKFGPGFQGCWWGSNNLKQWAIQAHKQTKSSPVTLNFFTTDDRQAKVVIASPATLSACMTELQGGEWRPDPSCPGAEQIWIDNPKCLQGLDP